MTTDNTPPVIGETPNNPLNSDEVTPELVSDILRNISEGDSA